jgi:hypothetical protein
LEASKGDFWRFLNIFSTIFALVFNARFLFFFSVCTFFVQSKKPQLIFVNPHCYDAEIKCLKKNPKKHFGFFLSITFGFLREKTKKVQKSDFPRKRSHFRKKYLGFVTTKKNSIFPKLF